jgi:hypothetical protein
MPKRFMLGPRARAAVTATGIIWSRYATQITPVNYNLLSVNMFMACTGLWHLYRIGKHYYLGPEDGHAPPSPPAAAAPSKA